MIGTDHWAPSGLREGGPSGCWPPLASLVGPKTQSNGETAVYLFFVLRKILGATQPSKA